MNDIRGLSPEQIADRLQTGDKYTKRSAAEALGKLGVQAKAFIPQLTEALTDSDGSVRWMAAVALGDIGPDAAVSANCLALALKDDKSMVQAAAAKTLGTLGTMAAPYAADLATLLRHPDHDVRMRSAGALGKLGSAASPYVVQVVADLQNRDEEVRCRTAELLCELGPSVLPHGMSLLTTRNDGSERVCDAIKNATGRLARIWLDLIIRIVQPESAKAAIPATIQRDTTTFFMICVEINVRQFHAEETECPALEVEMPCSKSWVVEKTYEDFAALFQLLVQLESCSINISNFPRKHMFGCNGAKLEARRQGLESFMGIVVQRVNQEIRAAHTCDFHERERNLNQKCCETRVAILSFLRFDYLYLENMPSLDCFAIPAPSAPRRSMLDAQ